MANTIELANKYLPILDEVYHASSLTSILDAAPENLDFVGADQVKVYKATMQGLGDYNRNTGYVDGDVSGEWEVMKLTQDRGRSFSVDRMDNEETLNMAFGRLSGEFIRTKVVPEVDAYRFAKYASASGIMTGEANLADADAVITAIDAASAAMDEAEVPGEGRILFITPTKYALLKRSQGVATRFATMTDTTINRNFDVLDNKRIILVPQTRFYNEIELNDGTTGGQDGGGYKKKTGAKDINFMLLHPSAVLQIIKHALPRIFDPDTNQKMDAWKFDYRVYHDAFVLENKTKAVYAHLKPAE